MGEGERGGGDIEAGGIGASLSRVIELRLSELDKQAERARGRAGAGGHRACWKSSLLSLWKKHARARIRAYGRAPATIVFFCREFARARDERPFLD